MKPMRRSRQQLSEAETMKILRAGSNGVLSVCAEKIPYGVPLNYVLEDRSIYFHCAKQGRKMEMIRENPEACFTVVCQDEIHPESFTSYFKSAMAFGKISLVEDETEIRKALKLLCTKYSPDVENRLVEKEIEKFLKAVAILRLDLDAVSGKQAIELVRQG